MTNGFHEHDTRLIRSSDTRSVEYGGNPVRSVRTAMECRVEKLEATVADQQRQIDELRERLERLEAAKSSKLQDLEAMLKELKTVSDQRAEVRPYGV